MFVNLHYSRTSHPIAAKAPHPVTGTSWDFLVTLAMRGDFKERRTASSEMLSEAQALANPDAKAREWYLYAADLARHLADGTFAELAHPGPTPADPYALIPPEYVREEL